MLHHFVNFVFQRQFKAVRVQVFQSLSILVENIAAETSLFSLFSKDHIDELISYRFDANDDVRGAGGGRRNSRHSLARSIQDLFSYYISFLKSISMKLTERTIVFFFNPVRGRGPLMRSLAPFSDESTANADVPSLYGGDQVF